LAGKYTTKGQTVDVTITWEVPGRLRLDITGKAALVFDDVTGPNSGKGAFSADDVSLMESLVDDSAETFLYGTTQGVQASLLGGNFRTDDGKNKKYTGPWYSLYETYQKSESRPGNPYLRKRFYFDSQTRYLWRVAYPGASGATVTTDFTQWKVVNGQAYPGRITRTDGTSNVFQIDITTATFGASAADSLFPGH